MSLQLGDLSEDQTVYFKFTTALNGVPTTLGGTPVLSVYIDEAAATEKTTAETYFDLDVDFDGITGYNNVRIDTNGDAFFATGGDYTVVITTGTIDGTSVAGTVIANFSILNRASAVDLANATDGLGAIKTDTEAILADTGTDGVVVAAGAINEAAIGADAITAAKIADNAFVAANFAASSLDGKGDWNVGKTGYTLTATTGLGNQTANITGTITTATNLTNAPTNGDLTATMKTSVNTEVLDVMNADTITLPGQEAPPLAPTHRQAIGWLYKVLRNRKKQDATSWVLYADNETTVDAKATVSDDGTDAIKQEIVSGP